jgi:hypothetical protein
MVEAIDTAKQLLGRDPDLVLQVGDAEPYRNEDDLAGAHVPSKYRSMGLFSGLGAGDLSAPVYFIGGNHEPYVALDACEGPFPLQWSPGLDVFYLGRCGAARLAGALRVGWLSGIYSPTVTPSRRDGSIKSLCYFVATEVNGTLAAAAELDGVDVLLTHDWPSGVGLARNGGPAGNDPTRDLVETVRPALHLCGHMHFPLEAVIGTTVVHGLNAVPPALEGKTGPRDAWWRLYELEPSGAPRCVMAAR